MRDSFLKWGFYLSLWWKAHRKLNTSPPGLASSLLQTTSSNYIYHAKRKRQPPAEQTTKEQIDECTTMVNTRQNAKRCNSDAATDHENEQSDSIPSKRIKNDTTTDKETKDASIKQSESSSKLHLVHKTGDIFNCAQNTLIIHACNCQGSWGAGIAKAFKQHYPSAFTVYGDHCKKYKSTALGKALLIPTHDRQGQSKFVGCLFTSRGKGKTKDTPKQILEATSTAMQDLLGQVAQWQEDHDEDEKIGEMTMCKINSGLFGVPWEQTRHVLESLSVEDSYTGTMTVVERAEP